MPNRLPSRRYGSKIKTGLEKTRGIEEKLKRINELYHQSLKGALNDEEKLEQAKLRAEYIANVRANLKSQLDNVSIQEADGSITNLGEKFGKQTS